VSGAEGIGLVHPLKTAVARSLGEAGGDEARAAFWRLMAAASRRRQDRGGGYCSSSHDVSVLSAADRFLEALEAKGEV
jgi:hypothetical protein